MVAPYAVGVSRGHVGDWISGRSKPKLDLALRLLGLDGGSSAEPDHCGSIDQNWSACSAFDAALHTL